MRLSEYKRELVLILSSVSILSNGQWLMFNVDQCSIINGQWSIINGQCSKMRLSERRAELVRAMPSVSILDEVNVQCK